jgi:diguanylate cyclase (GGDEF)-like protein
MLDFPETAKHFSDPARALRLLCRVCLATIILLSTEASLASDLDSRIDEAERLGLSDPASVIERLQMLEEDMDSATPSQRTRIEMIRIRALGVQGQIDRALAEAIHLSSQTSDPALKISTLRLTANIALYSGRFELAFARLTEALDLLDEIDSPLDEVVVFGLASFFHSRSGDTWLALDYATRSLESARASGEDRLQCLALAWLANAHLAQNELETTELVGERARSLCESAQDRITLAWVDNLMARLMLDQGRLREAREALERSRALNEGSYSENRIENGLLTARLQLLEGRNEEALEGFDRLAEELGDDLRIDRLVRALQYAAEAATRLGDMPLALEYLKRYVQARQSELERTRSLRMAQLSTQFDRVRSEREIELLREQQRVSELDERVRSQQRWIRRAMVIAGLLVVSLLLIGLWRASRERRHYRQLSDQDGLTGLYNHSRFFRQLDQELGQTHEPALVLIFADIDHFKQVNDRFGHQIGDEVLHHTARIIKEIFGENQLIGRIGGEEFGIRLLGLQQSDALGRVEELRSRLAGRTRRRTDPPITLSFGLTVARDGESPGTLRRRADAALYQAKAEGRNRVVVADPSPRRD